MTQHTPPDPELPRRIPMEALDRYLAGECTPEEAGMVARWIELDPLHRELVDALPKSIDNGAPAPTSWNVERMWEARGSRASRGEVAPTRRRRRAMRIGSLEHRTPLALRIAAVILVAVLVGLLLREGRHGMGDGGAREIVWREYSTAKGQRAEFDLADGTHVRLNVESRLRIPSDYGRRERSVSLEGEAMFEVEHDSLRPFRVRTSRFIARDLGTSFVVRAYPDVKEATVAVMEGVVSVTHAADSTVQPSQPRQRDGASRASAIHGLDDLVLRGGDVGSIDSTGELSAVRDVDTAPYTAWVDGRLVFRDAPLRTVLRELDRWYDLECRLADSSLGDLRVTASFQDEPPSEVIDLLALSLGLGYERQGSVVTFRAGRRR